MQTILPVDPAGSVGIRRALALDLDGTLLDESACLDETLASELKALPSEWGIFLFTGRMLPSTVPFHQKLGLTTPIVCYNGAKIVRPGEAPLFESCLEASLIGDVVEYTRERGIHLNLYYQDDVFCFERTPLAEWYANRFLVPLRIADGPSDPALRTSTKLLLIVEEEALPATYADVRERFRDRAIIATSSSRFVEVLPVDVNKGTAMERLAEQIGLPLDRWVAAGDGLNDYEMLKVAGLGAAISTGDPALRDVADVVVPPLWQGGLKELMQHAAGRDGV